MKKSRARRSNTKRHLADVRKLCRDFGEAFLVRAAPLVDDRTGDGGILVVYRSGGMGRSYEVKPGLLSDEESRRHFVIAASARAFRASA